MRQVGMSGAPRDVTPLVQDIRMHSAKPTVDPGIFLLADHLDAALAAGEDLLASVLPALDEPVTTDRIDDVPQFVARLARNEAALIARVLQARRRASELPRLDAPMRPVIGLILAQTESLMEIIEQFGDQTQKQFASGDDPLAFLRRRGVLPADAASLSRFGAVSIGETYRLAGVIELGPLLDMVSGTLEALDVRYDLFVEDDAQETDDTVVTAPPIVADALEPPAKVDAEASDADDDTDDDADIDDAEGEGDDDNEEGLTPGSLAKALQVLQRAGQH